MHTNWVAKAKGPDERWSIVELLPQCRTPERIDSVRLEPFSAWLLTVELGKIWFSGKSRSGWCASYFGFDNWDTVLAFLGHMIAQFKWGYWGSESPTWDVDKPNSTMSVAHEMLLTRHFMRAVPSREHLASAYLWVRRLST